LSIIASIGASGGRRVVSAAMASGVAGGTAGLPVVDMIEVRERVFSGWLAAISWAIIPPMEAPTMCAFSIFRASSNPTASAAMSSKV
jgi:hypothetical protein